jgi:hypothetical protein
MDSHLGCDLVSGMDSHLVCCWSKDSSTVSPSSLFLVVLLTLISVADFLSGLVAVFFCGLVSTARLAVGRGDERSLHPPPDIYFLLNCL